MFRAEWAIGGFLFTLAILFLCLKFWLIGSLSVSGIKSVSKSCHKTYAVESVPLINGNWFCEEKTE